MRQSLPILFALASVACASGRGSGLTGNPPPGANGAAADSASVTVRIPATVGAFSLVSREDFDDRSAGVGLRYRGPDELFADAYVYPASLVLATCGAACADSAVHAETRDFVASIPEFIRRGYFGTVTVTHEEALRPPDGVAWSAGRYVALAVTRRGVGARSDFYLFLLRGYKVKVRATYPDTPASNAQVRAFTDELLRILPVSRPAAR